MDVVTFEPMPGPEQHGVCGVCLEETTLVPLGRCHHTFCHACLRQWFVGQCDGTSRPKCPASGCNMPVSIYDLCAVLKPSQVARFDRQLLQHALADMPDFRWCPRCSSGGFGVPNCANAQCLECGHSFCVRCLGEPHDGYTCAQSAGAGTNTTRWLVQHTKPCPGCGIPISKTGGCSHMTCPRCSYQFCWYCLGKYKGVYTFEPRCPCGDR